MGLGPPVCTKCMRFMDFHQEPKISAEFDRTLHVYWDCLCGVTQYDPECTHLFCLDGKDYHKIVNGS